ncbi:MULTISPECIES: lipopolysaccharide assembly protein LapA domain-containing protein [Shimia]|uniref:lipopolysaccharide assembly protein LapA domain-containing protein n=1 Tax=Shimia TaxID=573139 RepID=UPI001FB4B762|nr:MULTISPECIES: LapA family protein [Shimia]MDV4145808.1 LapA family protein [Shimia sp. FJ5]
MRYIRYAFLAALAIVLISVAMANRGMVTLSLLPEALADLTGFGWTIALPLYAVIFASIAAGVLIGFIWEWLREHKHRAAGSQMQRELKQTKREMRRIKGSEGKPQDEVLAILDEAS